MIGIALIAIGIAGCQKELDSPTISGSDIGNNMLKMGSGKSLTFYESGDDYGCHDAACDCMQLRVASKDKKSIDNVFTAVQGGNSTTIQNAFLSNKTVLLNYATSTDVNNVINGVSTARSRGTDPNKSRYLIVKSGTVQSVYMLD